MCVEREVHVCGEGGACVWRGRCMCVERGADACVSGIGVGRWDAF